MPRPEAKVAWIAVGDLVFGAVFVGSSAFGLLEHALGILSVAGGVKVWRDYWEVRDTYEAWRRGYRRH